MVEFDKGLQRKKRTKESVKSTALGGGDSEGNHAFHTTFHEYWFTNQFIFKNT